VIEGNSFLRVHGADVAVLVVSPSVEKTKRSAKILLNKIDFIVINVHKRHTVKEIENAKRKCLLLDTTYPFM
jgi:quercetin dioxygenase-like cupin family protein